MRMLDFMDLWIHLKIVFVCDYYSPHIGGAELVYKRYCEGLAKRGHSVRVITIKHSKGVPNQELINGVEIQRINTFRNSRYLFILFSIRKIFMYVKDADIVHCAFFMSPFSSFPAAKLWNKPLVVTVHEVWGRMWFRFEKDILRALFNYLGERLLTNIPYDVITCCSIFTFNSLRILGVREGAIIYIPNGVDFEFFKPRIKEAKLKRELNLDGSKVYMYYGRPGISKGVRVLIKAAALIKKRINNSKLLLILDREPIKEYKNIINLINKLNLWDHIRLLDPVPREDLPRHIALADLVVVPSLSEGFGFTAVEAGAMEKPVVATYAGSLPEVVSNRDSGLLVKPNSVSDLYEAICSLLENEDEALQMGRIGRGLITKFDWNKSIDSIEKLYEKLLDEFL